MHADEIHTDAELVRRLLSGQFPQWATLPAVLVPSFGTDHDIYRLGERLSVRLPRIGWAADHAAKEERWLPRLAPHLPLAVPTPVAIGEPDAGYPFAWSVHEWLPGQNANDTLEDLERAALDLAAFVNALQAIETTGARLACQEPDVDLSPNATGASGKPWWSWTTASMARPSCDHGSSRWLPQPGTAKRCGSTATCCRATCSS